MKGNTGLDYREIGDGEEETVSISSIPMTSQGHFVAITWPSLHQLIEAELGPRTPRLQSNPRFPQGQNTHFVHLFTRYTVFPAFNLFPLKPHIRYRNVILKIRGSLFQPSPLPFSETGTPSEGVIYITQE